MLPFISIFVLPAIVIAGCASEIARRHRLAPMINRPCAGRHWRRSFPDAPKADIREFLRIFNDAFVLPKKSFLSMRPSDKIMDVYRAMYPPKWTAADSMELEIFAIMLENRYGPVSELAGQDDLTLGEIFSWARSA